MKNTVGRYSKYIKPALIITDLLIINSFAYFVLKQDLFSLYFIVFNSLSWLIIALNVEFYKVYRFTKGISILNKTVKQFIVYFFVCYFFIAFYLKKTDSKEIILYIISLFLVIATFKLLVYYSLKKYRSLFGGNFRNVIIIGDGENAQRLSSLFSKNFDYGCKIVKEFRFESNKREIINEAMSFVLDNKVDVIYCSLDRLTKNDIYNLADFAGNNLKSIKFIPENEEFLTTNQKIEYYDIIPVLSLHKTYLDDTITKITKRVFDVFFSIFVIVFLLSWLVPILAIFIKLESKGPIFFKQGRPGFGEKEFFCYKFRSMKINQTTEKEASKNDPRVTKIGRFIRKTSLDEMPQFLNVLFGDMSVVGPRPHLWSQNRAYGNRINKYMMRHYVKPGITGLAQVKGCRGEIESDEEMKSRINYDVFYIENWSLIMDVKIIVQTVINIFQGEEKAY